MSLTKRAASYAARLSLSQVPLKVRDKAKQALRDHLACAIGGSQTDLGALVRGVVGMDVEGPAAVLGGAARTSPGAAAFCNATSANAMDFDDTSSAGHPGATLIAAALSATTVSPCNGRRFLAAVIAGYEVGMRVSKAIKPSWARYRQVHGSGTAHVFCSVAASGHVLGLNEEEMERAFGIAGSLAPVPHAGKYGWNERPLIWMKDNVSWPAEAGLRAARLAKAGMPASRTILDGEQGFWVMAGSDQFNGALLEDYSYYELAGLSFKPYPCCRWIHTTLDALDKLQREHDIRARDVEQVEVETIQLVAGQFTDRAPMTMVDAEFSLPHAVSMKLLGVGVSEWWMAGNRTGAEPRGLMAKVEVRHDPALTERYLAAGQQNGCIPSRVIVRLAGGARLEAYEEVALGEPVKPMSEDAQLAKFHSLAGMVLLEEERQGLLDRVANIEAMDLVAGLVTFQ